MKRKKILTTLLIGAVSFCSFKVAKSEASFIEYIQKIFNTKSNILRVEPKPDKDYIRLDWDFDNSQPYTYKAYKKTNEVDEFQTISMIDLDKDKKISVLNIYPSKDVNGNIPLQNSFTTWDNEIISNLPKSASLKKWMEEPNPEDNKGYGKGILDVTPLDIESFNKTPLSYLKDLEGNYIYDVIVFGFWDSNGNNNDLNSASLNEIKKYISSGKGVLFGHDTIRTAMPNFKELRSYINIELPGDNNIEVPDSSKYSILSRDIIVRKKGLLTEYPWKIDKTELSIPETHSSRQFAKGDIWLDFFKIDTSTNPGWEGIIYNGKDGKVTNNVYLTTWNNTAYIQTGHSNGQATPDEQKILANTILYLSQLSSDNYLNDMSGQDVDAPENPVVLNSSIDVENSKFIFNLEEIEDRGTKYSYYVEATGQNDGEVKTSNIAEAEIKSGLKGYSYIIDTNPGTEPNNEIDTFDNIIEFNFNKPTSKKYYLHIKSIDNVGNFSETIHYEISDTESPILELTISTTVITNNEVSVIVNSKDNTKVECILLPNNQKVYSNNIIYDILENGEYRFIVYDIFGNHTEKIITINNIDKEKPSVAIDKDKTDWTNKGVQININTKD